MRHFLLVGVAMLLTLPFFAQGEKVEREYRVDPVDVPSAAREWLATTFSGVRRLKWYYEETSGKRSFEAKFTSRKRDFSVEFSEDGLIEDIEMERNIRELPEAAAMSIERQFPADARIHILRIQEQWTGDPDNIKFAVQVWSPAEVILRYEVEFTALLDGRHGLWEGTFSEDGILLSYRRISMRPVDNLGF